MSMIVLRRSAHSLFDERIRLRIRMAIPQSCIFHEASTSNWHSFTRDSTRWPAFGVRGRLLLPAIGFSRFEHKLA